MKNMLKKTLAILIVVSLVLAVAGCGGKSGGSSSGGAKKDALDGTTWNYDDLVLTFKSPDWNIKMGNSDISKGTYTISDNTVTIRYTDTGFVEERTLLNDTTLLLMSGFNFRKQ